MTEYYLEGSRILGQKNGTNVYWYHYDSDGTRLGMEYAGEVYYYYYNAQGDVLGLFDKNGTKVVEYVYDSWGKVMSVTGSLASTLGQANPFRYRGYYYDGETQLYYLNSRYYDPETGRFINADGALGVNSDMATYNLFVYCGNNPIVRYDSGGMFWKELVSGILHTANDFAIAVGIDTAAIGAAVLGMQEDSSGVYHASFDCWQQYFGYNDLYDFAFNLGTSMQAAKFSFSYNGSGYTIWAWKGDYINLGAGAELGIYRGSNGHRTVDTSLAMWMALILTYNGDAIIEYFPNENQWWITGFNPNYRNVQASDLTAVFGVGFNSSGMYHAFKKRWGGDSRWSFYDNLDFAILYF